MPDSSSSYLGAPLASPVPPATDGGGSFFGPPGEGQTRSPVSMRRAGRALSRESVGAASVGPGAGRERRVVIQDPSTGREGMPTDEMMRLNFGGGGGGLEGSDESEDEGDEADEVADDRDRPTTASSASASGRHSRSQSSHSVLSDSSELRGQPLHLNGNGRRGPPPSHQATLTQATATAADRQATITPRTAFPAAADSPSATEFGATLSPGPHGQAPLSPLASGYRSVSSPVATDSSRGSPMLQGVSGGSIMMRRAVSGEASGKGDSAGSSVVEAEAGGKERTRKDSNASHLSAASKLGRVFGLGRKTSRGT